MVALSGWTFVRFPCVLPIVLSSQEQAISRGPKLRYLLVPWRSRHVWTSVESNYPKTQSSTEWCAHPYCVETCAALFILHIPPSDKDVASEKGFCTCKRLQVGSESRLYHWVPVEQASALKIVITTICYQLSCMWMGQGLWEFSENPGLLLCVCETSWLSYVGSIEKQNKPGEAIWVPDLLMHQFASSLVHIQFNLSWTWTTAFDTWESTLLVVSFGCTD